MKLNAFTSLILISVLTFSSFYMAMGQCTAPISTKVNNSSCSTPAGSITFTAPGPAGFLFSIDGGTTFGTSGQTSFTSLSGGVYSTVSKNESTGCISPVTKVTITDPASPAAPGANRVNSTNCTNPNGSITFTGLTPLANYQFSIDGGVTFGAPGVTLFSGLDAGTYPTVAKLISTGCISSVTNRIITKPVFVAGPAQSICQNQTITTAATAASGAGWMADPGNPSATTITNASDPTTVIKGFTMAGIYNFTWGTGTCNDKLTVTVTNCDSPIGCVNTAFLIQQTTSFAGPVDLISVDINTGIQTTIYTDITNPNRATNLNAMGYNPTDDELWGSVQDNNFTDNVVGTGTIFRIGADGEPHYFRIPGLYNAGYNSGTIDGNGILYLYNNGGDLFRVDVNPASPTYLTLLSKSNTASVNISDFAYNPVDGFLYAVANSAPHQLYKINPNTGAVTTIGNVSGGSSFGTGSIGAAYFDAQGNLYAGDNQTGGIYKISTVQNITGNTTAVLRSQGQPSSGNDGAICYNACIKPDAGPDIPKICMTDIAKMAASQVSGIAWLAQSDNPGSAVIADPANATTDITGFSAPGIYHFIWTNGGTCNDTISVTVSDCALPVKLISFTATKVENKDILLEWATSSEENSKEFRIERSADAATWTTLQTVQAASDSKSIIKYSGYDHEPFSGTNYYRLKMVDLDDTYAFSKIRSIDAGQNVSTTLYPNPVSTTLSINPGEWNKVDHIELTNLTGILVYKSTGNLVREINVKEFPAGLYVLRISRKDGSASVNKVMINK
ncbi:T9SS type A sorting domain-containing protein [Dyadobacter sp. 3J3]|uniref:T9SS type A sorting domain-containing protein n=1 Tax=Dyadobacter sp. 3J3 TaxID=2606600 RepID=UPI0013574322|nr:T9SS type A sorting domain-containing protein [Dyadobacter sp. 3J3]